MTSFEDDNAEEVYLDRPDISKKLADTVRGLRGGGFSSEVELLQYLLNEKPEDLKFGREHYLKTNVQDEHMNGLSLKLKIHGYDDRGERLKYLYSTLQSKLSNKDEIFKILVQFLMDMSIRPTAVTHMELNTTEYSPNPDEEDSIDEDSEKQRELLKQILLEEDPEEDMNLQYSSDSDLSEWSTDEDESLTEKSNNDIPPIAKIRTSSSFGEFSDLPNDNLDPEIMKQEAKLYWMQEQAKSEAFFQQKIRKFNVVALTSQPVISSLLVLQSRFGEFWEWKRSPKQKSELLVAFEEDVVREILWQFVVSNPKESPVFTETWVNKSNLIVATLSKSSFSTIVNKFGCALLKLQCLRKFADVVQKASTNRSNKELSPSKMYRNYASGLQEVSVYITAQINIIERELKKTRRDATDTTQPGCTTLIQLERRTRSIIDVINILYEVHYRSVPSLENGSGEPWLASIKLISCFETYMLHETKPSLYGVLLFFYSRCLHALLDDFISILKTLKWDEKYSLFVRDPCIRLNDSNFWSQCVKVRKYSPILHSSGISPLMCLEKLLPKMLNILKTCEVLNQLEEDFTRILSKSSFEASNVINEFLANSLAGVDKSTTKGKLKTDCSINYLKHFEYIGLGNSYAKYAFRFLTSPKHVFPMPNVEQSYKFEDFANLSVIPFEAHSVTLEKVLFKSFTPFCLSAQENIQKIFQDYKVIESMSVFQEIILMVREDFARTVIEVACDKKCSEEYKYEDTMNRNPKFQKLLNEFYPDGRGSFAIELKLDTSSDMNCTFLVTPYFPLNLIVTPRSVAGYLFIGRQLHRIRKSLWDVSSLSMKDCRSTEGVDVTRLLMFRFCLINFCSSIRSFFTLKLFSKDYNDFAKSASYEDDLDSLRRIHEDYMESIKTRMLRNPLIENIIIRKIVAMSEILKKKWKTGISQQTMIMLEDTLKKCWQVVNGFESTKYSFDFNELSHHFGPPPSCLT